MSYTTRTVCRHQTVLHPSCAVLHTASAYPTLAVACCAVLYVPVCEPRAGSHNLKNRSKAAPKKMRVSKLIIYIEEQGFIQVGEKYGNEGESDNDGKRIMIQQNILQQRRVPYLGNTRIYDDCIAMCKGCWQ